MATATMSSRPIWSGSISFGLVTIPVKLFTAVREKNIHFRSLHDQDQTPLKMKMYCPADGKEVHREHIVKGYEVEKDQFVIIRDEELQAIAPKATKSIDIQDFVALDQIDPLYFDRPYYIVPRPEGAKPYRLLLEALESKGKVGIAKVVMHNKEYLAAVRPLEGMLCLETMHFSDEVVSAQHIEGAHTKAKLDDRELKMAEQLVDSLSAKFNPDKYHDEYRQQVMDLVERKAKGEKIVLRPTEEEPATKGGDLIAALEASLAKARGVSSISTRPARAARPARQSHGREHPTHRRRKSA
jgi:DNA end-binding protein Ku